MKYLFATISTVASEAADRASLATTSAGSKTLSEI